MGIKLNRTTAMDFFGVSGTIVDRWRKEGMPTAQGPERAGMKEVLIDSAEAVKWLRKREETKAKKVHQSENKSDAKQRKLEAEADKAEIEVEKLLGKLVDVDFVTRIISNDYVSLKQRMRVIPNRIAPMILGETEESVIKEMIMTEIDQALNELSEELIDREGELLSEYGEGEETPEAATEDENFGVGGCEEEDYSGEC